MTEPKYKVCYFKNPDDWEAPEKIIIPLRVAQVRLPEPGKPGDLTYDVPPRSLELKSSCWYIDKPIALQLLKNLSSMGSMTGLLKRRLVQVFDDQQKYLEPADYKNIDNQKFDDVDSLQWAGESLGQDPRTLQMLDDVGTPTTTVAAKKK